VVVQTACSTSLAAVHLACQSLLAGECDSALAGGVSVAFPQVAGYPYIPGMILSPDGVCRPFDERARGTVPGRGAGLVVLKRLADAERDGDTVYAVIAGSAWNNDGSEKVGYTAPSVQGQAEVIRGAHAAAGIGPERIGFVEAHGTGTELGDPIEVAALAEVFGERTDKASCVLGSVKANMGHADVAAGVAGLIKAALSVYHGVIPPTPHFEKANTALGLGQTPFHVSAEAQEWPVLSEAGERWAGVSSFGIGGTNVHLCLRNAEAVKAEYEAGPWVFPVSAKTSGALEVGAQRLGEFVVASEDDSLGAAAATLQTGRRVYPMRRVVVAGSVEELAAGLASGKAVNSDEAQLAGVAFLFPGQGLQFAGMAAALFTRDARFRELIEAGLGYLPEGLAGVVHAAICGTVDDDALMSTSMAQPLLFLVEYALAMRWMDLGVMPAVLLGHSLGELTAAAVAGVFSFEDGVRLAAERGRLMQETPEGAMLAVSLAAEEAGRELTADLWIAAENAPELTVVSGSVAAIEALEQRLAAKRVATVRLKTDRAFHTPDMAAPAEQFEKAVAAVERGMPRLRWLSNVSGTWITPEEAMSPKYWAEQMTARVRFAENAATLAKLGGAARHFLLEAGPGDALTSLTRQHDRKGFKASGAASSLGGPKRRGDDYRAFLEVAARLWERGVELAWELMPGYPTAGLRRVALPTYAFERERFWVEATAGLASSGRASSGQDSRGAAPLTKRGDMDSWFYAPTWRRTPAAEIVLPKRDEPVTTWVMAGGAGDPAFADLLSEVLEEGGARVLHLPVDASRAELEEFWKKHRDEAGTQVWGLVNFLLTGCLLTGENEGASHRTDNAQTNSVRASDVYVGLMEILQTAVRARVRFVQTELIANGLVSVMGERVEESRRGIVEGLVRMLPAEFGGLRARVIDPGAYQHEDIEQVAEQIAAEVGTVASGGLTVALRKGSRWQEEWLPVRMEKAKRSRFREGGTYVITGGLGGVGYVMARHLLLNYGAKVALVGRTVLPRRTQWEEWLTEHGRGEATSVRIQRAKELEACGGEVLLLTADVADGAEMSVAWKAVEEKLGLVHGVIHAAGLTSNERVMVQSAASVEKVLRPKVQGSEVLAELLAGKDVDFLMFCSSISAIHPAAGAAPYAAANAFQDRYAAWCRQHLGVPAVTVNLDTWRDVGMAAELYAPTEFEDVMRALMAKAMTPEEGIEAVERVLACGEGQMLISTLDLDAVFADTTRRLYSAGAQRMAVGDVAAEAGEESAATQETLAVMAIWQELLGADEIARTDNFFELGGHSLLGTMVLARIREQYGVELSIRAIFEAPTPEGLGERIRLAEPAKTKAQPVVAGEREEFEI